MHMLVLLLLRGLLLLMLLLRLLLPIDLLRFGRMLLETSYLWRLLSLDWPGWFREFDFEVLAKSKLQNIGRAGNGVCGSENTQLRYHADYLCLVR